MCEACGVSIGYASDFIGKKSVQDFVSKIATDVCITFDLAYPSDIVCPGMIEGFATVLFDLG